MPIQEVVVYDAAQKLWSAPDYPYWNFINQSVGEAFLENMRSINPNNVLEYWYDTNVERKASEIYREAVAVALSLQRLGVQKGDVIVLYSMNNVKTTALIMGSFLVGAVPLCMETKLSKEHIDHTLKLVEPFMILYEEAYAQDMLGSLQRSKLPTLKYKISIDAASAPNVESELLRPITNEQLEHFQSIKIVDPMQETALFALTSGSTGVPKAVDIPHAMLLHGLKTWWYHTSTSVIPPDAVAFSFSPLRWISQIQMLLQSTVLGVKRVCASGFPSGPYGRDIISKSGITHFFSPPIMFLEILRSVKKGDVSTLSKLRIAQLGGESPAPELLQLAKERMPNGKVFCCYGMTEVSGCITNDPNINGGKLTPGLQMQILDDNLQPVGHNVYGQLSLKAPVPFKGYYKLDRSKYVAENGFFINGDYGYFDEQNNLHLEGRYKDLVRTKDIILIPNKIERLISELAEVSEARLIGYHKPTYTDDVGAVFVKLSEQGLKSSSDAVQDKIRKLLQDKLPASESNSIRDIFFVTKIPLTTCGKSDRVALRNQASQMSL